MTEWKRLGELAVERSVADAGQVEERLGIQREMTTLPPVFLPGGGLSRDDVALPSWRAAERPMEAP